MDMNVEETAVMRMLIHPSPVKIWSIKKDRRILII